MSSQVKSTRNISGHSFGLSTNFSLVLLEVLAVDRVGFSLGRAVDVGLVEQGLDAE